MRRIVLRAALAASLCTPLIAATAADTAGSEAVGFAPSAQAGIAAASPAVASGYGRLPLEFEPNMGQAPAEVKYLAHRGNYSVGLTESGAVLSLPGTTVAGGVRPAQAPALLQIRLLGAKLHPALRAEQQRSGVTNYLIGSDPSKWQRNIPNFGAIRYEAVYPGVDWVVYGNPQQLEYDLIVAPQADPHRIRLRYEGADKLALDQDGNLMMTVHGKTVRQIKPAVYQIAGTEKQGVKARYIIDRKRRELRFALGPYDPKRSLVIDPVLAYSTYLGGSDNDSLHGIAVDASGNVYVAGITSSSDFPTLHPFQAAPKSAVPTDNAFVAKLNPSGTALVYSTFLGGGDKNSAAFAIALDGAGNAYVAGSTSSRSFPIAAAIQPRLAGTTNAFVSKLNASGNGLVYSTFLGGSGDDEAQGIAVTGSGDAFITGATDSPDFPLASPLQGSLRAAGKYSVFVARLNPAGSKLVYSTYLGGTGGSFGNGIAVDGSGDAYVVGSTKAKDFPTVNALQRNNRASGNSNGFVSKLNPSGSALLYSTYLGGDAGSADSMGDSAHAVAVDKAGNAYVGGYTSSANFPVMHALQARKRAPKDSPNGFVSKLNPSGSALVYSSYLGGSDGDSVDALTIDEAGNVYVAGSTFSSDFPLVQPLQQSNRGGRGGNAFVAVLKASGDALTFSTYLGGSDGDIDIQDMGIAVDSAGSVYVAGATDAKDFPLIHPLQAANKSSTGSNAFIAKIKLTPN